MIPQICVFFPLLPKRHDIRRRAELLEGPHATRRPEARLHFVVNEQRVVLIRVGTQPLKKLGAQVMVAALGLDRLDENCGDALGVIGERVLDLSRCPVFGC
jgi:hypothetical protein